MAYAVVFKGNSENIHQTLTKYDKRGPASDYNEMLKIYHSDTQEELVVKAKQLSPSNRQPVFTFTFVRDPLSHFISGLVESHYRRIYFRDDRAFLRGHAVNVTTVADIVLALVMNNDEAAAEEVINKHLLDKEHFATLSSVLWKWRPDFIGYLETFQSDWTRLNAATGLNMNYEITEKRSQRAFDDPLGMKRALKHILRTKPNYMRAVCRLLMMDYVCLNYPLPAQCAHMKPKAEDCDGISETVVAKGMARSSFVRSIAATRNKSTFL
jgi:hypothetical protein